MTDHTQSPAPARARAHLSTPATTTIAALIVAAAGVVVQIVGGVDYPTVPPVMFILLIPAALLYFGRWRWAAVPAVLAGLFLTLGLFTSGASARLVDANLPGGVGGSAGLWVQSLAVVVALVAGVVTTVQRYRGV